ncbi:MAG: glycosyltransferase [Desulfitobacteriaceae bacterium]
MDKNLLKKQISDNIVWLIEKGLIEEAEQCLRQFQQFFPDDAEYYSMEAGLFLAKGNANEAITSIQKGLLKNPWHTDLLQNQLFISSVITQDSTEAVRAHAMLQLLGRGEQALFPADFKLPKPGFRVLQGTMEIANQMNTLTAALNKQGISAQAVNYHKSYLGYNSGQDVSFEDCRTEEELIIKSKMFAAEALSEYDIFHFHFGTSLTWDHSDLPLLKSLEKKAVMHYWGSDVRRLSVARQHNPYVRVKNNNESQIVKEIENISAHISDCIVADQELYLYVKDLFPRVHFLPQAIDLVKYEIKEQFSKRRPLLVHAPTSPEIKGTKHILKAIDILHQEYEFDFQLIQGLSHEQAQITYQQADLIIDQILVGSYGLLAVEAMAMGKPVVCWISEFMRNKYPAGLPIIVANPDTITDVLRYWLKNQDMLAERGRQGRKYTEIHHDADIVVEKLVAIYQKL